MLPVFARGPRVALRHPEAPDAPLLVRWVNDPDVSRFLARAWPIGLEEELSWLKALASDRKNLVLMIVARDGDVPVGVVGLHGIALPDRNASFGIFIGEKDRWNRGLGSEATELMLEIAFERLGLNRVELDVYVTNTRAVRVYEKAGFRDEGVARQGRFKDGRFVDVRRMAILAEEWRETRSPAAGEVCQT